jgi:hypothetical protein
MQTQAVTFIATDGLALCTPDGVCP